MDPQKIIDVNELNKHNKDGDEWICIKGKVYDISKFMEYHPGGKAILKDYSGKNATDAFEEVGHNQRHISMIKRRCCGILKENGNTQVENGNTQVYNYSNINGSTSKLERLFTHEDKLNIHKISGLICLISFLSAFVSPFFPYFQMSSFNIFNILRVLGHFGVVMTSLQFVVPKKRNIGNKAFEHMELRGHAVVFSLRSISVILLCWLGYGKNLPILLLSLMFWHKYADYITKWYHLKENGTTIRGSIKDEKRYGFYGNMCLKYFMSISQIFAITALLGLRTLRNGVVYPDTSEGAFLIMMPIQMKVFLNTLHKKDIISNFTMELLYVISLVPLYFLLDIWDIKYIFISLFMSYLRFKHRINKYALYFLATTFIIFF